MLLDDANVFYYEPGFGYSPENRASLLEPSLGELARLARWYRLCTHSLARSLGAVRVSSHACLSYSWGLGCVPLN